MQFTRMHGCRNVFLVVDERTGRPVEDRSARALRLCGGEQRPFADGILYIQSTPRGDVRMVLYNRDGSRGAMCGNGIRCVGKYVVDRDPQLGVPLAEAESREQLVERLQRAPLGDDVELSQAILAGAATVRAAGRARVNRLVVESDAGLRTLYTLTVGDQVHAVTVDLGLPTFSRAAMNCTLEGDEIVDRAVTVAGRPFRLTCVSTGNLHGVIFVPAVDAVDLDTCGPALERAPFFPDRANIHFVQVDDHARLRVRNWERGAGPTAACGTGACASAASALATGRAGPSVHVEQPGGVVHVQIGRTAYMTGPAEVLDEGSDG